MPDQLWITTKRVCFFAFAYEKSRFSHDAAHIINTYTCMCNLTKKGGGEFGDRNIFFILSEVS